MCVCVCVCACVLHKCRYSNIFVTSPSPENLRTVFEFVLRGFDKIELVEHEHYDIVQSTQEEFHKAIIRINIFHKHRQTVQVSCGTSERQVFISSQCWL